MRRRTMAADKTRQWRAGRLGLAAPIQGDWHGKLRQIASSHGGGRVCDDGTHGRTRLRRRVVSGQGSGLGSALQHGEPAQGHRIYAAREGVEALADLRVLPAYEGRLLD